MKALFFILLTSPVWSFTLNNNFGASFKMNKVKVYIDSGTTCATAGITVNELEAMIAPAVDNFWNTVPTSKLRLSSSGFTGPVNNINSGRLCSPTDDACIDSAAGNVIAPVDHIVIACNDNVDNFPSSNVLAVTIPNKFSGRKIAGSVILINNRSNVFSTLSQSDRIAVIAHEIGHAIGLGHAEEKNKEALMYFRTVSLRKSLAQDDIDGVSYLYPVAGDACGFLGTTQEDQGPPIGPQILLSFLLCFVFVELHQRSKTRTTL